MVPFVTFLTSIWDKIHSRKFILVVALGYAGFELVKAGMLAGEVFYAVTAFIVAAYIFVQGKIDVDDSPAKVGE